MARKRTFISFDYDHDVASKNLLVGQARLSDSPFEITDMSIKEAVVSGWQNDARTRIKGCDVVIVLCGDHTNTARGVSIELNIAKEEGIPYFLLAIPKTSWRKPTAASSTDEIYTWNWENLTALIHGRR